MQDFDELKQLKAQCIADIREALPLYANRLNSIDERLMTYNLYVLSPPPIGGRLSLGFAACYRRDARKQGEKETANLTN